MLIFALALAAPTSFTAIHNRDIGCVATLAIIADEQRRKVAGSAAFPDMQARGKRWAGIVGDRIVFETGQPRELVAFAMTEAAKAEQAQVLNVADPAAAARARVDACVPLMEADIAAADAAQAAADAPLPKPIRK